MKTFVSYLLNNSHGILHIPRCVNLQMEANTPHTFMMKDVFSKFYHHIFTESKTNLHNKKSKNFVI